MEVNAAEKARLIAFYLPQFHPIPENDEWWGVGFTEWTNVAKAKPLYRGHRQPHRPTDLGYYDLRVPEVREQQAALAREAGIAGFCYWHYWFGNGRRILERPFDEMLASGRPDFPFCLAWANQPWSGVWHGRPGQILIEQHYPGLEDYKAHFELLLPAFRDHRYLKIDGRPIFVIFDPMHMGQKTLAVFAAYWRDLALEAGLPGIHFIGMANRVVPELLEPFDMLLEHGPGDFLERLPSDSRSRLSRHLKRRNFGKRINALLGKWGNWPHRFEYKEVIEALKRTKPEDPRYIPCVVPNWDNTPRCGSRGMIYENATVDLFEDYLRDAVHDVEHLPPAHRLVFLKAWNEWAEGNYVEPDDFHGHRYLDAIRRVMFEQCYNKPSRDIPKVRRPSGLIDV